MKAVILAGGFGTRFSEETALKPKPMIEVGGRPLLWHIMKIYEHHGIRDFLVLCGYRGHVIKEYFADYFLRHCDATFDLRRNKVHIHHKAAEPWSVTVIDTGEDTMTGGRLKRAKPYLGKEDFCFTYGDGVADVDVRALVAFHKKEGRLATLTSVRPQGRFGALRLEGPKVKGFAEKPSGEGGWINGGFFVMSPRVLEYIEGDGTVLEREPLERLALEGSLSSFRHRGFWQCMDTLRDKNLLEELWDSGRAPWKVWE
jgi:glucose-1-phosphate cytidylyltransferase